MNKHRGQVPRAGRSAFVEPLEARQLLTALPPALAIDNPAAEVAQSATTGIIAEHVAGAHRALAGSIYKFAITFRSPDHELKSPLDVPAVTIYPASPNSLFSSLTPVTLAVHTSDHGQSCTVHYFIQIPQNGAADGCCFIAPATVSHAAVRTFVVYGGVSSNPAATTVVAARGATRVKAFKQFDLTVTFESTSASAITLADIPTVNIFGPDSGATYGTSLLAIEPQSTNARELTLTYSIGPRAGTPTNLGPYLVDVGGQIIHQFHLLALPRPLTTAVPKINPESH